MFQSQHMITVVEKEILYLLIFVLQAFTESRCVPKNESLTCTDIVNPEFSESVTQVYTYIYMYACMYVCM